MKSRCVLESFNTRPVSLISLLKAFLTPDLQRCRGSLQLENKSLDCCSCCEVAFIRQCRHPGSAFGGTPQTRKHLPLLYHTTWCFEATSVCLSAARPMPPFWRATKAVTRLSCAWALCGLVGKLTPVQLLAQLYLPSLACSSSSHVRRASSLATCGHTVGRVQGALHVGQAGIYVCPC